MAFTPEEIAAGERLGLYNIGKFGTANPYGLGQGGQRNYITAAGDLSLFGAAVVRETRALRDASAAFAEQVQAAAILIEGGPVSSVNGQTGDVTIDLSELSDDIREQLSELQGAQARVTAYTLAFGG